MNDGNRRQLLKGMAATGVAITTSGTSFASAVARAGGTSAWRTLPTDPYPGKQDDIFFVDANRGWYGNGKGRIYGTVDGGESWGLLWEQPGTFVRALGFIDAKIGILGNIGVGDFPEVTDTRPLYRTVDGGRTWAAVTSISGPQPQGICAIDILQYPFVNAGVLNRRITVRAGGRVGGPAFLMTSRDLGVTWRSEDMSVHTGAILDIHFLDERTGFIAGATSPDVNVSNALVLMTSDGGASWRRVYQSARPFEMTWKLSFPSSRIGYVTVQNYDEDPAVAKRVVAKTSDGGLTWHELPLAVDHGLQEFGVGFVDELHGWVGGRPGSYETRDGGTTWVPCGMGTAVNKVRIVPSGTGVRVFAIGREIHRLDLPASH